MDKTPLEVEVIHADGGTRVIARGELDLASTPDLDAALIRADAERIADLVLDLREVTFIDSSGIRCVLDAYHRSLAHGADLRIRCGLEAGVVFGLAGLSGRLPLVA